MTRPAAPGFARADVEEAAGKLADLLADEHADLLLSYDPQGLTDRKLCTISAPLTKNPLPIDRLRYLAVT